MIRLFRILALVMAAVWLPLTAHCELEAISAHAAEQAEADGCCTPQTGCTLDTCDTLEGANLLPASISVKIPLAAVLADTLRLDLTTILRTTTIDSTLPRPDQIDRPLAWTPVWQFARRAAGLARAPSLRA